MCKPRVESSGLAPGSSAGERAAFNYPRRNVPKIAWRCRERRSCGFTLLELALALLILVLGASVALSLAGRIQQRRNCDSYIHDLHVFSTAFEDYYQQHKTWPPSSDTEVALPVEIEEALKDTHWSKGSPFGGSYGWVAPDPASAPGNGPGPRWEGRGAVTLTAFSPDFPLTLDKADLLYIDRQIDDGNLATGQFRTGFNGWPVFLVEAAKR
jgi:prepilin-type N-terminal cleavage/methylation domain-containing protein